MQARARLIAALTEHLGLPVRRILEAGCGTGMLRTPLRRLLPRAHYVALESSEYLCGRYGWKRGRIEAYRSPAPFDLLICYDVLQYLDAAAARRALANFGRLCRGVLYFSALTRLDFEHNCDPRRTDSDVHLRSAHWYRSQLRRQFREAAWGSGCGAARRSRSGSWSRSDGSGACRAALAEQRVQRQSEQDQQQRRDGFLRSREQRADHDPHHDQHEHQRHERIARQAIGPRCVRQPATQHQHPRASPESRTSAYDITAMLVS